MSITKKSDLHTDRPLWSITPRICVRTRKTPRNDHYDVVVVGAGISGALMASALADGSRSVLVIDRRRPVGGSSLASTAMIQHEIDVPLSRLGEAMGKAAAARVWSRSMAAVERLALRVKEAGIRCAFRRKRALFLSGDDMGWRALRSEADLRGQWGFDAEFLDGRTLREGYGIERTGAILTDCSASANPAQMTAGFLRHAAGNGTELVSGVEVTDLASAGGDVVMTLKGGRTIGCRHAVFCTGYEFLKRLARLDHETVSTWAIATKPNAARPSWLDRFLVWEASDPYLYLRSTFDGRIVAGGEDEADERAHLDRAKLMRKARLIARKAARLLGTGPLTIDYAWAGPFGVTSDGLPIIGEMPDIRNVFAVMGYGGNGITFSQIASEIVAARIAGRADPDEDLFGAADRHAPRRVA